MKPVVNHGPRNVVVEDVDDPSIEQPLDAIIRITTADICGSDAAFEKGISIGTGQCAVKAYNRELRDLIIAGRATPSFIVSHELALDDAVKSYEKSDVREDGWTKVLLHPGRS